MLRGNDRQTIFFTDAERKRFINLLEDGITKYGHSIHAFCLMPNHVHLAIQVQDFSLSKIMQNLGFRYAQWINKKEDRVGHLFQGRYKAILVDKNNYLLRLVRYIHLNPIRACIVNNLDNFEWSSHQTYLGKNKYSWVKTDWFLSQMSDNYSRAIVIYRKYLSEKDEEGDASFHFRKKMPRILGSEEFILNIETNHIHEKIKTSLLNIIKVVCQYYCVEEKELFKINKSTLVTEIIAMIAWLAKELKAGTMRDIALYFQKDETTLIRKLKCIKEFMQLKMEEIKSRII